MTKVKTLYVNLKRLINEHIMLKTYCFEVHASAIFGPFAEVLRDVKRNVFAFGTWLEDVKIWNLNLLIPLLENLLRN